MPTGAWDTPSSAGSFRCEISREDAGARVKPVGELDLDTVPILSAEIELLRRAGYRQLIVDLTGLTFMDSTGLRCLLDYDAEARRDGFTLHLVPGSDTVQRIFELTQTRTHLRFIDP